MKIPTPVWKIEKNAENKIGYKFSSVFQSEHFRSDLPTQKYLKLKSIVTTINHLQTHPEAINNQKSSFRFSCLEKDEKLNSVHCLKLFPEKLSASEKNRGG